MYGYKRQFRNPALVGGKLLLQRSLKALDGGMVTGTQRAALSSQEGYQEGRLAVSG